jgi:hypothetical protein
MRVKNVSLRFVHSEPSHLIGQGSPRKVHPIEISQFVGSVRRSGGINDFVGQSHNVKA